MQIVNITSISTNYIYYLHIYVYIHIHIYIYKYIYMCTYNNLKIGKLASPRLFFIRESNVERTCLYISVSVNIFLLLILKNIEDRV